MLNHNENYTGAEPGKISNSLSLYDNRKNVFIYLVIITIHRYAS
jgi:hypothetical protein